MESEKKDYYEILEVNIKASKETISKVFKMQIKKNHPDLFQGEEKKAAEEKTMLLNEAYEVLSDEKKREAYDKTLNAEKNEQINFLKEQIQLLKEELLKKQSILQQIREEYALYDQERKNMLYNKVREHQNDIENTSNISNINRESYYNNENETEDKGITHQDNFYDFKVFLLKILGAILLMVFALFTVGEVIGKNLLKDVFIEIFIK